MIWNRNSQFSSREKKKKRHDNINQIAYAIYMTRLSRKQEGNSQLDWELAEKIASSPLRKILFDSNRHFIRMEKGLWEPLLKWAESLALISLLGLISNIGIIVAVSTYVASEKHRRDAEILNAWQTISSAYGQAGSGGRLHALEFLNASPGANWRRKFPWICAPNSVCTWPKENLSGINLAVATDIEVNATELQEATTTASNGVYLRGINLQNANLQGANLRGADLRGANLAGANLKFANIQGAFLVGANLKGANLADANLETANLFRANLEDAFLIKTNLKKAFLASANLKSAGLEMAILEEANLYDSDLSDSTMLNANLKNAFLDSANFENAYMDSADLERANLSENTNFRGAILSEAILSNITVTPEEGLALGLGEVPILLRFLDADTSEEPTFSLEKEKELLIEFFNEGWICRTALPSKITTINPNRDCQDLGIDPESGTKTLP